jgi:hypothetical protein
MRQNRSCAQPNTPGLTRVLWWPHTSYQNELPHGTLHSGSRFQEQKKREKREKHIRLTHDWLRFKFPEFVTKNVANHEIIWIFLDASFSLKLLAASSLGTHLCTIPAELVNFLSELRRAYSTSLGSFRRSDGFVTWLVSTIPKEPTCLFLQERKTDGKETMPVCRNTLRYIKHHCCRDHATSHAARGMRIPLLSCSY